MQSVDGPIFNVMLTKFTHATDLRNTNRISIAEFRYYMVDEVENLTNLDQQSNWSQVGSLVTTTQLALTKHKRLRAGRTDLDAQSAFIP